MTIIRNICAHNDRLYTFGSKFKIKINNSKTRIFDSNPKLNTIVNVMEFLLPKDEYNKFKNEFNKEISSVRRNITSINIDYVLKHMGLTLDDNSLLYLINNYIKYYENLN